MGFILNGLEAEAYDRSYSDATLIRRIAGYFRPQARNMVAVALFVAAAALVEALIPLGVARGIDLLAGNLERLPKNLPTTPCRSPLPRTD